MLYSRHSGRDSLRVNANLFQTDWCRKPEHGDVKNISKIVCDAALKQMARSGIAIHGFWNPAIPAGMANYLGAYTFDKASSLTDNKIHQDKDRKSGNFG